MKSQPKTAAAERIANIFIQASYLSYVNTQLQNQGGGKNSGQQ